MIKLITILNYEELRIVSMDFNPPIPFSLYTNVMYKILHIYGFYATTWTKSVCKMLHVLQHTGFNFRSMSGLE